MFINNNKKTNRRLESTKKYIDDLSKKYSKLNIVRVDLGYTKEDRLLGNIWEKCDKEF